MLTQKDQKILAMLRNNSRETLTHMSRKTQIPVSTIFDRLIRFNKGIITKHTSLVDFQELGYNARASVMIKANPINKDELHEYLRKHSNVNSMFKINNGFDFMIDIVFSNMRELEQFVQELDLDFKIRTKIIYYIIEEVKQEEFLAKA